MNATAEYGSIEVGKVADVLILDGDPLGDVRNTQRIHAVVFNGNLYDRAALDELHHVVRRRARSWAVGCRILWDFLRNPVSY
jgi:cytosine/adenosine deaminase-related metal-dependent hydrolase